MTLNGLSEMFGDSLGMKVSISDPYKLCDFRPAYGYLFRRYIEGFDYWGHGDIDLVYGDMLAFLKPLLKEDYDVISFTRHWISGSLCFYRARDIIEGLYRESPYHKQVFQHERHLCFDEVSYRWRQVRQMGVFGVNFPYDNMTLLVKRAVRDGRIRAYFGDLALEDIEAGSYVHVAGGRVNYQQREYPYFHWVTEKRLGKLKYPDWDFAPDEIFITQYGFYNANEFRSVGYYASEAIGRIRFVARFPQRLFKWKAPPIIDRRTSMP
jgi:hypothetical protein